MQHVDWKRTYKEVTILNLRFLDAFTILKQLWFILFLLCTLQIHSAAENGAKKFQIECE